METGEVSSSGDEQGKIDLLTQMQITDQDAKDLEKYSFEQILGLTREELVIIFGGAKGIFYSMKLENVRRSLNPEGGHVTESSGVQPPEKKPRVTYDWQSWTDVTRNSQYFDDNYWHLDDDGTEYAKDLLSAGEILLGNGVMLIDTKLCFPMLEGPGHSTNMFVRVCQQKLWTEVDHYCGQVVSFPALVTGSPGIGKTWSFLFFLRLLLRKKKLVIFELRTTPNYALAFIPQVDGSYKVWECTSWNATACKILKNPDYYYLIDMSKSNSFLIVPFSAHVVVCASPRILNNMKEFKVRNHKTFVMPVWRQEECVALLDHMKVGGSKLTEEEVNQRYVVFGGRIRFIFTGQFDNYKKELAASMGKLSLKKLKTIISSPTDIPDEVSAETEPSMLFVYAEKGESETRATVYKYEMLSENYVVTLGSETIVLYVIRRYWDLVKSFVDPTGLYYQRNPILCGNVFEVVVKMMLASGGNFNVYSLETRRTISPLQLQPATTSHKGSSELNYFEECAKLPSVIDNTTSSSVGRQLCASWSPTQPVVDLMDANDRGYQVTTSERHTLHTGWLQVMKYVCKFSKQKPLRLYYVIPKQKIKDFTLLYPSHSNDTMAMVLRQSLLKQGQEEDTVNGVIDSLKDVNDKRKYDATALRRKYDEQSDLKGSESKILDCVQLYIIGIDTSDFEQDDERIVAYVDNLLERILPDALKVDYKKGDIIGGSSTSAVRSRGHHRH